MKKQFALILVLLFACTGLHAQTKKSNDQVLVNQAIPKFFDGLAALDTNVMKQYTTLTFCCWKMARFGTSIQLRTN